MDGNTEEIAKLFGISTDQPKAPKTTNKQRAQGGLDVPDIVNDELSNLGWSPNARLAMVANLGRENSRNANTIFQGHTDPANYENNLGIISWQKERRPDMVNYLRQNGGDLTPNENNLRLMTRFIDHEMNRSKDNRVRTWQKINQRMKDPNLSLDDAYPLLQKYIQYRPEHEIIRFGAQSIATRIRFQPEAE